MEIDDKEGEASSYGNLGTVFQSVGEYQDHSSLSSLQYKYELFHTYLTVMYLHK